MSIFVVAIIVVALVALVALAVRVRGRQDPVDSFRRQIDALGPKARRPTIDQVRRVEEDSGETEGNGS